MGQRCSKTGYVRRESMSMELAFLVIERAAVRNTQYHALLYLALKANEVDITHSSARSIAQGTRMSLQRARLALKALESDGYLSRARYGAQQNPNTGYYVVHREALLRLPRIDGYRKSFAGRSVREWRERIASRSDGVIDERNRRLREWTKLPEGEKHAGFQKLMASTESEPEESAQKDFDLHCQFLDAPDDDKPALRRRLLQ
jgi:hypothetical protein